MKNRLFIYAIAALLCLGFERVSAEDGLKSESGLDAILVVDSSGSMLLTDPQRLRDEGAKLFIQSMKAGDKLGLIEFSDSAKVIHELSEYKPEQDKKIAEEIAKIENDGIYTDLLSGIKLSQEIFKKNPTSDREQIIILFSDGKMDPDPSKATPQTQNAELFNNVLPELKAAGIKVHTLALSEKADKDLLAQIAASTEGISIYASDATLIHQAFTNLFLAVKKPQVLPLTSKGFKIDSDIQEATFYINREPGDQEIIIMAPSGKRYSQGLTDVSVKWFRSPQFDVITILNPEAGNWKIDGMKSQDGFATLLTNLKLVTDWPASISADEDKLLQARLYEDDKPVVLHGMSNALEYAFQVVPTDKISEPIIKEFLKDDGKDGDKIANDGIFSKYVKIMDPGQYTLKVVAHSPTFDRYQHLPFQVKERLISLSVENHTPHKAAEAHHEEGAEVKKEEGNKEEEGSHEEPAGPEDEYFTAKLSTEAGEMKKLEVKLLAIDKERNRFVIDMVPSEELNVYEVSTNMLPAAGLYEVEAGITGIAKTKKLLKASSQRLKYLSKKEGAEVKIVAVPKEGKTPEAAKELPSEPSFLLFVGLATLWNILVGAVAFSMFKKASSGPSIILPVFEDLALTQNSLKTLKDKLTVSEVDLNDPMFSGAYTASTESKTVAPAEGSDLLSTGADAQPAAEDTAESPQEANTQEPSQE
jgi:uncharacterized protein (TIGR03503 family)